PSAERQAGTPAPGAQPCACPRCRPPPAVIRPEPMTTDKIRMGILGAARIAPMALVAPARSVPEVEIAAVAARDFGRARAFAKKHGIPHVAASYEEMLA